MFVERAFLEKQLDDLDNVQITLEQTRDTIKARTDLISEPRRNNVLAALRYAARYLHDVFEDFERGKLELKDSGYEISTRSENLMDFLSSAALPEAPCGQEEAWKELKIRIER